MIRRLQSAGFTLVELVVAVGVTAILAAGLLAITSNTLKVWHQSVGSLTMENQAALIIDRLARDVECAVWHPDGRTWMESTTAGQLTSRFRCFAAVAPTSGDPADPTALRAVVYELGGEASPYRLYRDESTAEAALVTNYTFPRESRVDVDEYLLGELVYAWRLSFWRTPTEELDLATAGEGPRLVRVELTLISPDGVARLAAVGAGRSNESTEEIIEQCTRTFTRWMQLRSEP